MIRHLLVLLIMPAGLLFGGCTADLDEMTPEKAELSVTVQTADYQEESKAIFTGTTLTSGSIGLSMVRSSDDGAYDGKSYNNLQFTYSSSKWSCSTPIYLSPTSGKVYAYYPYSSSASITAVPIDVSTNNDYMYATAVNVSHTSTAAALTMKHALAAVTITVKKGTYTGTGSITACTWSSATAGKKASMNAKTGALSSITGGGEAFNTGLTSSSPLTVNTSGTAYTFLVVPTATAGKVTFNVTMDGKAYAVEASSITYTAGNRYNYNLVMDSKEMTLGGITVTGWSGVTGGSYTPVRQ